MSQLTDWCRIGVFFGVVALVVHLRMEPCPNPNQLNVIVVLEYKMQRERCYCMYKLTAGISQTIL